jgi:hypothetical protein
LPDPKARRKAVVFVIVVTIIGVLLTYAIGKNPTIIESQIEDGIRAIADKPFDTALAISVFLAPIVTISIYLFFIGIKIANAQRFPIPGTTVIRDTKLLAGSAAIRHARIIQLLTLVVIVLTPMLDPNL